MTSSFIRLRSRTWAVLFLREPISQSPRAALSAVFDTSADLGLLLDETRTAVSENGVSRTHRVVTPTPGAMVELIDDFEANARYLKLTGLSLARAEEYFERFAKYVATFRAEELVTLAWSESNENPERLIQAAMASDEDKASGLIAVISEALGDVDPRVRGAAARAASLLRSNELARPAARALAKEADDAIRNHLREVLRVQTEGEPYAIVTP